MYVNYMSSLPVVLISRHSLNSWASNTDKWIVSLRPAKNNSSKNQHNITTKQGPSNLCIHILHIPVHKIHLTHIQSFQMYLF